MCQTSETSKQILLVPAGGGGAQSITGAYWSGIVVELPFSLVRVRCRFLVICVPRGGGFVLAFFCLVLFLVLCVRPWFYWSSAVVSFFVPLLGASRRSVVSFWPFLVLCVWPWFRVGRWFRFGLFLLFGVGFDPLCLALVFFGRLRRFRFFVPLFRASCWSVVSLWPFCYCLVWCWSFAFGLGFGRVRRFRFLFLCSAPRVKSLNLSLLI